MAGVIGWHELFTNDVAAASRFYAELLGAEIETADMGDMPYPMLKHGGKTHAGFVEKPDDSAPNHWYPYVIVDEVDAAVEQATSLGAQLYHGPADVSDTGIRFAVLGDPQHATFGVISSPNPAAEGLFVWNELHSPDTAAAKQHYGALFGWTTSSFAEGYDVFNAGETMVGGVTRTDRPGASWLAYLLVDDTDAATARAQELGATVLMEPESMEGVGRYSVIADPTGAATGLHQRES